MRLEGRNKKPAVFKKSPPLRFEVSEEAELLVFLLAKMPQKSRNDVNVLLRDKNVFVDGATISQFNHPLKPSQKVQSAIV